MGLLRELILSGAGLWLLAAAALAWLRPRARGTTLTGPWIWSLVAVLALALAAFAPADAAGDPWRWLAFGGAFCPLMSLLGAKRPQDRAWHFIVASLWMIQILPALEVLWLRPGQPLAIIDARAWLIVALIGVNLLVYLPTRHWLGALAVAAAQAILFWNYFPWISGDFQPWQSPAAGALCLTAVGWGARPSPRSLTSGNFDRLWLDFRDSFGALWAARVLERVNASALMYDWPVRLGWSGFHDAREMGAAADIPPELTAEVRQNLVNLLRRFVDAAWIEERFPADQKTLTTPVKKP